MRALVVDDSNVMRRVISGALRQAGVESVDEAADGLEAVEAVEAVKQHDYGIIMMDWNMPNMDGLEAVRAIREDGITTPIIMVTTENDRTRVLDAVRAGVSGFITKPFTPDTIISKIKNTVESLQD